MKIMSKDFERLGPANALSVVWVGHSLIETKVQTARGEVDLVSTVADFARHGGLSYNQLQHTLWGSPLSALWRGSPHSYEHDAAAMVGRREAFEREAQNYDTMVLTDVVPADAEGHAAGIQQLLFAQVLLCTEDSQSGSTRIHL